MTTLINSKEQEQASSGSDEDDSDIKVLPVEQHHLL